MKLEERQRTRASMSQLPCHSVVMEKQYSALAYLLFIYLFIH